jgi:hypothetical protein
MIDNPAIPTIPPISIVHLIGYLKKIKPLKTVNNVRVEKIRATMKWSDTSGHRVKTLKCHNEVRDDNRKANEKEIYRRLQA